MAAKVGNIRGPQGIQGVQGVQGVQGPQGPQGAPGALAAGSVTAITGAADATRTRTITFPTNRFTALPQVVVTLATSNGIASTINTECWVGTITLSSFNLGVNRSNATDVAIRWIAVQDPGAAVGLGTPTEGDAVVVCPTEDCSNQGVAISVFTTWTDENGVAHEVDEILCGVCDTVLSPGQV